MTSTRPLRDKAALVIGGSRGIGRAVTERLAADVCFYEDSTVKLPASRRNLISASEGSGRQNRSEVGNGRGLEVVLERASIRAGRRRPTPHAACAPGALAIPGHQRAPSLGTVTLQ